VSERRKDLLGAVAIGLFTLLLCAAVGVLAALGMYWFAVIWLGMAAIAAWNCGTWIGFYRNAGRS
jgi:hypothetical protein